ncbi:MAG TPA: Bax inhibitor-1/YccA family protein [Candidatus Ozemobacteraceae bacterium]|nr:Bax inhibitor-1/YccA family protein [Candidatus Ozemobacteraceae bacterium]
MEFHDRVGAQEGSWPEAQQKKAMWTGMSQSTFMSRVLPYFGGGLILTALGTAFAKSAGTGFMLFAVIANFAVYFALLWNRHTPGLNVALFYGYTFLNGLMLGPLVALANAINPWLVVQALALTAVGFFAIATYVMTTGKDFSGLGPFLIAGLLVVIVAGILNFFVGGAGLGLGISIVSALLFMGFTAYDMSNIMLKFRDEEYILATVELYLDFINLFIALLRILIHIAASNRD